MPSVDLGTRKLDYSVVRGTSGRYTYFRFRPDLTLEVVLPRRGDVDVERLLRGRMSWVKREYARLSNTKHILTDQTVLIEGEPLRIVFDHGPVQALVVDRPSGEVRVQGRDRREVREQVRRYFLRETSAYVVKKVTACAPLLGVRPRTVDVREIGKWGYCTKNGRLSFSWQLIALPESLREYVVFHELCHLRHFDHSNAFKKTLRSVCTDFRSREKELDRFAPYDRLGAPD